jgi:hypothetical protein
MSRYLQTFLAGIALAAAVPSQAAVTLYGTTNLGLRQNLSLLADFTKGQGQTPDNSFGTFLLEPGQQGAGIGSVKVNQNGTLFNSPPANAYLEIKGGTYTRVFAPGTVRAFSFLFEGLDAGTANNISSLRIDLSNNTSELFGDLQSVLGGGLGRAYVDTNGPLFITSVVFRSTTGQGNAAQYNVDGFAIAAPEPATWGMLILGFGMAGVGLRRRAKALRNA